jgi:hypothetical protein
MPRIHGAEEGEVAQEMFYFDDEGNMFDSDIHEKIIFSADHAQIDETIMAPIRAKYYKKYAAAKPKKRITKPTMPTKPTKPRLE